MVKGTAALHRRFKKIPLEVRREVSAQMEKEAGIIVRDMKRVAPVKSGRLRKSIAWTWGDAPAGAVSIKTFRGNGYGKLRISIFAGQKYDVRGKRGKFNLAKLQEFGTQKMPANPFFFPVWRANRRRASGNITRAVRRAFKRL